MDIPSKSRTSTFALIGLTSMLSMVVVFFLTLFSFTLSSYGASCCGGGSGSSLVVPKFSKAMAEVSFDYENYQGFWNKQGDYLVNPSGSDLRQYRLNLGIATRLAPRWQMGLSAPFIRNDNRYSELATQSQGLGDMTVNVWYETFDGITCVSRVRNLKELKPAIYLGAVLTLPTGISPYDNDKNSMDITGRGFYRLDGNLLVEKTVYPINVSLLFNFGTHLERPVNREYGKFVEPYEKKLGNKALGSLSIGYTHFHSSGKTLTFALAYSHLWEGEGTLNHVKDPTTGLEKKSLSGTASFATPARDWVIRLGWAHGMQWDGWGENFPATDIYSLGVARVFL